MKEMVRFGFVLSIICVVAAGLLAGMNALTRPKILAQASQEEELSLKEVLPQAARFEAVKSGGDTLYFKAFDAKGAFAGCAFKASGKGYSSVIETMVGLNANGTIANIKVLSQSETPGLGANVANPAFGSQFANISVSDIDKVQAISGATISSQAVIDSVEKKAKQVWGLLKNAK